MFLDAAKNVSANIRDEFREASLTQPGEETAREGLTPVPDGGARSEIGPGEKPAYSVKFEPRIRPRSRDENVGKTFGHYHVLKNLGEGGMGAVYLAKDLSLDREVALKILSPVSARNADVAERFLREAKAQARVAHPNVAHIYYVGNDHDRPFFAMEYVHGISLEDLLDSHGPVEPRDAVTWTIQLAEALASAQRHGVTHRDIKPSNVIVSEDRYVKLTDFGLAKASGEKTITSKGAIIGTPYYISPEQIEGRPVDFKSDMYSLGATLYHMVYGEPPFDHDTVTGLLDRHLNDNLSIPTRPNAPILEKIGRVVERMMAKNPAKRYRSYAELVSALYRVRPQKLRFASMFQRMVATLEDYALAAVLVLASGVITENVTEWFFPQRLIEPEGRIFHTCLMWFVALASFGVLLPRSMGKSAMHIIVVDQAGNAVARWKMGVRGFFHFLPVLVFLWHTGIAQYVFDGAALPAWHDYLVPVAALGVFVSFCWMLFDPAKRMLHDVILGTVVIVEDK